MLTASGTFATLVEGNEMVVAAQLQMTLPTGLADYTLAVAQFSVDTSMTTDLPPDMRDEAGFSATGASFTLAGLIDPTDERKTAAWLFNPHNTASPMYRLSTKRAPVTIRYGLYQPGTLTPELLPVFTGRVSAVTYNPSDGTVTFTCVDMRDLFRTTVDIPPVVTIPPYNADLSNEFVLDALARASTNGLYGTWPAVRPQCVLAVGYRASLWPEVGTLNTTGNQPIPSFGPGVMGTALMGTTVTPGQLQFITHNTATPIGQSLFVEFWTGGVFFPPSIGIHNAASLAFGVPLLNLTVLLTGPEIDVGGALGGPGFAYPRGVGGGHYVSFQITLPPVGGTAWSATITFDGNTSSSGPLNFTTPRDASAWNLVTTQPLAATVEALQVTTETAPASNFGFVPKAVLDPSLNPPTVVPGIPATLDPWGVFQLVAESELGYVRLDSSGVLRFSNRDSIANRPVARTISALTSLTSLGGIETGAQTQYNHVQVPYTPWTLGAPRAQVWALATATRIPKRATTPVNATLDQAAAVALATDLDLTVTLLPGGGPVPGNSYYLASLDQYGNGAHPGLTFTITQPTATQITILVYNGTDQDAWLVSPATYVGLPAGTPVLQIGGIPVAPAGTLTVDLAWPTDSDDTVYQFPATDWLQNVDAATLVALHILAQAHYPHPDFTSVDIVPDPRLEVSDRARLQWPDQQIDDYAVIWGSTLTVDFGGQGTRTQTINARADGPPGSWLVGVPGRSEIGTTTYVYA